MNRDHPNEIMDDIGQNIEKSLGDLSQLAVTQTLVANYKRTLV